MARVRRSVVKVRPEYSIGLSSLGVVENLLESHVYVRVEMGSQRIILVGCTAHHRDLGFLYPISAAVRGPIPAGYLTICGTAQSR
jgi:hypothetical protein